MAYLKKSDYTLRIGVVHLDEILEQAAESSGLTPDAILANAEKWAQATIKGYLSGKYLIAGEFAKLDTDETRNFLVMQVMIDLVLGTIHKTINPRDVPEHIEKAYNDAIAWLVEARTPSILVDLPLKPVEQGVTTNERTYIGSQPKFISKPFQDLSIFDDEQA